MTVGRIIHTALVVVGAWTLLSFAAAPFLCRLFQDADTIDIPPPDPVFAANLLGDFHLWEAELADKDNR